VLGEAVEELQRVAEGAAAAMGRFRPPTPGAGA
jgi:hypothetical protein